MTPDKSASRLPLLMAVGFVAAVHLAWLFGGQSGVLQGGLEDGDSFMRLVRVQRLIETGDWFDVFIPRINAPFGATMHWTRPLDTLLLAIAAPTAPFLGFDLSLHVAAVALSPLLHILTVLALAWAAAPLIGRVGACLAGGLTATQIGFMGYATAGHADHHILYALAFTLAFGFSVRALTSSPYDPRDSMLAGLSLALGLWVGPEAYTILVIILAVIGIPWLLGEDGSSARNVHLCLGLTLSLALALLIERGPAGYFTVEYDRLSIIQVTMAALLLAFWLGVGKLGKRARPPITAIWAAAGAAAVTAVLHLLYPQLLEGPRAGIDPEFILLFNQISEFKSLDTLPRFLAFAGGVVFAAPWAVWRIFKEWPNAMRWGWVLAGLTLAFYLVMSIIWVRGSLYLSLFLTVFLADLIMRVDAFISLKMRDSLFRSPAMVLALFLLTVGALFAGLLGLPAAEETAKKNAPSCSIRQMTQFLNQPPWSARQQIISASVNFGPEILYRTKHAVLATFHHRGAAGTLDGRSILNGVDEKQALRLVRKRSVDLILICPGSGGDGYFLNDEGGERVLYNRLVEGDLPGWLKEVSVPASQASGFRLFQVASPTEIR